MRILLTACLLLALLTTTARAESFDVVVYGGTSGGVAAAIQVTRMGKSAVLIEPSHFLGGLTTGGLGATDIGNKRCIGGISREFYGLIWKHYNDPANWKHQTRDEYFAAKVRGVEANDKTMWTFEPHVATKIFDDMLGAAKVAVVRGERLDLAHGVVKDGPRITRIVMESGRVFEGKVFIDATYEGDLMAKAKVSYHIGREANATYGETINGVQAANARKHQFIKDVDPFIKPGDRASGLLPGIEANPPGEDFTGDAKVQAYNFRMCTTDVPANRRAWEKPANYDERWFELVLRNCEAGDDRMPWNPVWMPNRKTDTNNNFAISSDFIGQNWQYPDADYQAHERIWQAHKDWQMGLTWTLANNPRVPEKVRAEFQKLGLAKDEFTEADNWPRQLYIREARRMVSEYVMSEKNCKRREIVPDSVGMGAYQMDSHNIQRYVTAEGFVRNEGDVQFATRPYPISYRSIRPKASECTNLLVPICLSASHVAYGSIRMEPVFMVLGQSAATAAALAIDEKSTVQSLDYAKLKAKLTADGQVLDFDTPPMDEKQSKSKTDLGGIVVDDEDATREGFETTSTAHDRFVEKGYRHDGNTNKGKQSAKFTPDIPKDGKYEVFIAYPNNANRATNVPIKIHHANGDSTVKINQRKTPAEGDLLESVGTFNFKKGREGYVEITNEGTTGFVTIDAVEWMERVLTPPPGSAWHRRL